MANDDVFGNMEQMLQKVLSNIEKQHDLVVETSDMIESLLEIARRYPLTEAEVEKCNEIEDFVVNCLGVN